MLQVSQGRMKRSRDFAEIGCFSASSVLALSVPSPTIYFPTSQVKLCAATACPVLKQGVKMYAAVERAESAGSKNAKIGLVVRTTAALLQSEPPATCAATRRWPRVSWTREEEEVTK